MDAQSYKKMKRPKLMKKHTSLTESSENFRVAVFGQSGVGKTAMVVRFLTRRFIEDYDHIERIYKRTCIISPFLFVNYEILDTVDQEKNSDILTEKILWAEAFILVYSVTDRTSFDELNRLKLCITHTRSEKQVPEALIYVVGNKTDSVPDRMVDWEDGVKHFNRNNCRFRELSVRDSFDEVFYLFRDLYLEYREACLGQVGGQQKTKQSSMPIISHKFSPVLSLRKAKTFKHVDKIPRLTDAPIFSLPVPQTNDEQISPPPKDSSMRFQLSPKLRAGLFGRRLAVQSSVEQAHWRETTDSSCTTSDEDLTHHETIDPKQAAEDFAKKVKLLNLS